MSKDRYNKYFPSKGQPVRLEENPLIFLACVVPLAVYCLVLSVINRRRHAVFVPGPWDFAGVLFAASGILLVGGPAILAEIYEQWRFSALLGQTHYLHGINESWSFWISLWLFYFVVVAGVSALVLRRRRAQTSIYNVEPTVFAEVLTQVLDRPGLESHPSGPRRLLRFRDPPFKGTSNSGQFYSVLTVEPFPVLRHVTLHWLAHDEALRLEIETELAKALAQVRTRPSPVGAWFLSVSLGMFFSAFFGLLVLLVTRVLQLAR